MLEAPDQVKFYEDRYYRDRTNLKHNLSFAGCGFLGLYHVGVCCCLKKLAPHLYQNKHISGSSAGAIAAVCLVCDVNIAECVQYMCELINDARRYLLGPFDPRFRITEHLREGLNRILPSDAHVICSGRLSISMTSFATGKNVVVNQFRDKYELINAVLCSTFIPIFSGFVPPTFRGQPVLDGGLSDNLLWIDKMTIRISPFAGDADICPLDAPWDSGYLAPAPQHIEDVIGSISLFHNNMRVNISNIRRLICMVWPMESDELASLACQGYEDARRFLITRGFIACRLHRHPRSSVSSIVRGHFGLPTATSLRRFRRNASLHNLDTNHTDLKRKKRLGETESSHSTSLSVSPSPLNQVSYTTIKAARRHSACQLGWNVSDCAACQEELCKANSSAMPTFLLTIIRGSGNAKRSMPLSLIISSLHVIEQGWGLFQTTVDSSAHSLYQLGHHLFYLPIKLQLDLLIRIVTKSINLCPASDSYGSLMKHLSDSLTRARHWLTSLDSSQTVTTGADTTGPISASICRPNTRIVYPLGHAWDTSQPNPYPEPPNLTRRLSSAIMASTANFSDRLFCLSQIHLPNALECGLELFSIQSVSSSRQLIQNPLDQSSSCHWSSTKFTSPSFSVESCHSTDESSELLRDSTAALSRSVQFQHSFGEATTESDRPFFDLEPNVSSTPTPHTDLSEI